MYRQPLIDEVALFLGDISPRVEIEADAANVNASAYGPRYKALSGEILCVLGGMASGLEAYDILKDRGDIQLVVVDFDIKRANLVADRLVQRFGKRIVVFSSFASMLASGLLGAHTKRRVFFRVDDRHFPDYILNRSSLEDHVSNLCGATTVDVVDPLELCRSLRATGADFYVSFPQMGRPIFNSLAANDVEVSVIVPAYKISAWIDRCLQTLADQTLRRLEVIVVDDGSPDDTGSKADAWAAKFPGRIVVLHKENGGCAAARQSGLEIAKGEFVGFVDGDDWVDPHMFEDLYRAATLHHADIAQCGYVLAYESDNRVEPVEEYFPERFCGTDSLTTRPTIWRRIYRRSFLLGNNITFPKHIRRFDDLPFQFHGLSKARVIASIPNHYYFYRQERPGQDIGIRDERLNVHFEIFDWLDGELSESLTKDVEENLIRVELNTHIWALSIIDKKYYGSYLSSVARQLFRPRRHHSVFKVAKMCWRLKGEQRNFGRRILIRSLFVGK